MRPRDRVLTALRRQVPDRVPVFMRMTPPVLAALKARTGFDSPEEYFDFEIRPVRPLGDSRLCDDYLSAYLVWVPPRGVGVLPPGS